MKDPVPADSRTSSGHVDEVAPRRRAATRTSSRHGDEVAPRSGTAAVGRTSSRHGDEVAHRRGPVADGHASSSHGDEAAQAAAAANYRRRGPDGDKPDLNPAAFAPRTEEEIQQKEALHKQAQDFLCMFYKIFNEKPETIYELYDDKAIQSWTPYHQKFAIELVTKEEIKESWSLPVEPPINFQPHSFVAHQRGDFVVIMANGICRGYGRSSNYVQTFVLNKSSLIASDIVYVFKHDKPVRVLENLRPPEVPSGTGKDSNLVRRRSSRIAEQAIKLPSCKEESELKSSRSTSIAEEGSKPSCSKEFVSIKKRSAGKALAIVYDERMMNHLPEFYCKDDDRLIRHKDPCKVDDVPERLSCIINRLYADNLMERAALIKPTFAEVGDLLAMHAPDYVDFVRCLPPSRSDLEKYAGYNSMDVFCSSGTRDAVFLAAGATIKACELVVNKKFESAFAVVRPPGHHVGRAEAEGFCFANNVAIAASHLIRNHHIKKILVVDWDVHHGNGTQELFYSSKEVLFFSTFNRTLHYPRTSKQGAENLGKGQGAGYNVNVPLRKNFGNADLLYVWRQLLIPLVKAFSPDITIVSCGFDAAEGDPLGCCKVTPPCYATLLSMIREATNGQVILVLEGGYCLPVLADCAAACVQLLTGNSESLLKDTNSADPPQSTKDLVELLKLLLSRYWEVFKLQKDA